MFGKELKKVELSQAYYQSLTHLYKPHAMNKSRLTRAFIIIGIPTLYAICLRLFFGIKQWSDLFSVMSVSFLCCLPTTVGALTVYFITAEAESSDTTNFIAEINSSCVILIRILFFKKIGKQLFV